MKFVRFHIMVFEKCKTALHFNKDKKEEAMRCAIAASLVNSVTKVIITDEFGEEDDIVIVDGKTV